MNIYMVAQIAENSNHITYRNLYNERKDGMDVIAVGGPMKVEKKQQQKTWDRSSLNVIDHKFVKSGLS